jgi:hypothetical protein
MDARCLYLRVVDGDAVAGTPRGWSERLFGDGLGAATAAGGGWESVRDSACAETSGGRDARAGGERSSTAGLANVTT